MFDNVNKTVGINAKVATFVFVFLIGFLSYYVYNARIQVNNILKIDEYLHQLLFVNKKADVILEKDMKYYNYDNIEELSSEIKNNLKLIQKLSLSDDLNLHLKSQIESISNNINIKFKLIEKFKSTNAVLNNSYRYIMTLSSSLKEDEHSEKHHVELHRILMKVLSLSNNTNINIADKIQNITKLQNLKNSHNIVNKYFLLHAKLILTYYEKFTNIRANNADLKLESKLEKLILDYDLYNEKLIDNISFIIAVLIFIIVIFLLLFLKFYYQLEIRVRERTHELNDLNNNLEQKVKEEVSKNISQEKQLTQQSRSAAMGEMMGAIIHQWKQPLNVLSMTNSGIQLSLEIGSDISREDLEETTTIIKNQITSMNTTMEDFRNFFKPQKLSEYNINNSINDVIKLIGRIYETSNVFIKVEFEDNMITSGYPNELNQVIINILNNARDIIKETNCEIKEVFIKSFKENNNVVITITDCAGGVPENIIDKIFDPYVTTKNDEHGTGIGLDMSKTIIEKVNGNLSVQNIVTIIDSKEYKGAQFKIELDLV